MSRTLPIEMPVIGAAEAVLSAWLVEVGDDVAEGEGIVEVLIPKATVVLPSHAAGRLTQRLAAVNDRLEVGQILGVIESPDDAP